MLLRVTGREHDEAVLAVVALLFVQHPVMVIAADDPVVAVPSTAASANDDEREICKPDEKASGRAETERLHRGTQDLRNAALS